MTAACPRITWKAFSIKIIHHSMRCWWWCMRRVRSRQRWINTGFYFSRAALPMDEEQPNPKQRWRSTPSLVSSVHHNSRSPHALYAAAAANLAGFVKSFDSHPWPSSVSSKLAGTEHRNLFPTGPANKNVTRQLLPPQNHSTLLSRAAETRDTQSLGNIT